MYSKEDRLRAWAAANPIFKTSPAFLNQIDARAKELQQRTAAILAAEIDR